MSSPRVLCDVNSIKAKRIGFLNQTFSGLASAGTRINVNIKSASNKLFIGISDGIENGLNYTEWRFRTKSVDINANYHEVWIHLEREMYFLERSYLHIYNYDEELNEREYILLHCDASEPDNTPHSKYKQSPHIHIEAAKHPIPKAHIALYNGGANEVLQNLSNFNSSLRQCIELVDTQFLQLID